MKIYIADPEPSQIIDGMENILLNYHDVAISPLPFRKRTLELLKNNYENSETETIEGPGNSEAGAGQ